MSHNKNNKEKEPDEIVYIKKEIERCDSFIETSLEHLKKFLKEKSILENILRHQNGGN